MTTLRWFCAAALVAFAAPAISAQQPEFPKPGPEHAVLKQLEGTWDLVMKSPAGESKGTMTYKMELGGLWLCGTLDGEFGGAKFQGKGLDTYDAGKKKYVSVWVDNMITQPMIFEGTYDKDKKTLTMTGDAPGPDGKAAKWTSVTTHKGADHVHFAMYLNDGKDPMFTIDYKRKK